MQIKLPLKRNLNLFVKFNLGCMYFTWPKNYSENAFTDFLYLEVQKNLVPRSSKFKSTKQTINMILVDLVVPGRSVRMKIQKAWDLPDPKQ